MVLIRSFPGTEEKLSVLSRDSQYDLACACGDTNEGGRRRSRQNRWIYPVALPQKGKIFLFKTLMSNFCVNDCRYCPLRTEVDPKRCALEPEEVARVFFSYYRAGKVKGLFLSSGVMGSPDRTMERINRTARILRKKNFRGYIHLKIIPGASDAAVEQSLSLASAVSINIETAGERHFKELTVRKRYLEDVIRPMKLVSRLTHRGGPYARVKQTTQFVVGASGETDKEIVTYVWGLYKRMGLHRIYFSAYQRGLGDPDLPGEKSDCTNDEMLTREHRLYQVDWLIRKYGFKENEIPFEKQGNLSLQRDPKEVWAGLHPEFFPVDINRAGPKTLLRVPGLGPVSVKRIMALRKNRGKIRGIEALGRPGKRLKKAGAYLKFGY